MKKIKLFIICLLCSFTLLFAQDKIYRQNGKIIEAKIIEVGSGEIKYKEFSNLNGPIYVLESDRIKKNFLQRQSPAISAHYVPRGRPARPAPHPRLDQEPASAPES